MIFFIITGFASVYLGSKDQTTTIVCVFAFLWGTTFGLFCTIETLIFSMIVPESHEAVLAG